MKAATQSYSKTKVVSKPGQNSQETPAKEPILSNSRTLETCNLTKKRTPTPTPHPPFSTSILQGSYPHPELLFITF